MAEHLLDTDLTATGFADDAASAPAPSRARIVVIGGGIVGCSIAYHLALAGERDVVLVERARIGSGTSWHAAGLIVRARGSHALTAFSTDGPAIYADLDATSPIDVGTTACGSLTLASSAGRWDELRYAAAVARHHAIEVEEVSPTEVAAHWPLIDPDGVHGALLQPADGFVNPGRAALAFAERAHAAGVTVLEHAPVTHIDVVEGRVRAVETARGTVECEHVVLACGLWTRDLAWSAGAAVPLYAAEHVHVQVADVGGPTAGLPVLRDPDGYFYARQHGAGLVCGAFEPDGLPRSVASLGADFVFGEFPADWEHFAPVRANLERRIPSLARAEWGRFLNAPESFTPDANFLLGETNEVDHLWVAAGFNSQGIIFAPGAGRALAAWILAAAPQQDVAEVDVRRFDRVQANRRYLHARTVEGLGRLYAMHWPHLQPYTARDLRRTPLYERLRDHGACFGEANGWERAMWFAPPGVEPQTEYSYGRQNWFPYVAEEHRAAREAAALFDLSSFAKFDVAGPDALDVLQYVCTRDLDVPVGRVVYTLMLHAGGGIDIDGTVVRIAPDRFRVITPTVAHARTRASLERAARGRAAAVFDATAGLATLAVMGPKSVELLQRLSPDALDIASFPFSTAREIEIGPILAHALRVSFVGESGLELYVGSDQAVTLFDALLEAGEGFGLRLAGYHALDSLRCEKGFRHLGHDIGPADTPAEASMEWLVAHDKADRFRGGEALGERDRPGRRLRLIRLDDPEPLLLHGEPVLRDGRRVGFATSGAYGHTLGAACGLAMLDADASAGDDYLVDIAGTLVPATVSDEAWYDPDHARMRS